MLVGMGEGRQEQLVDEKGWASLVLVTEPVSSFVVETAERRQWI